MKKFFLITGIIAGVVVAAAGAGWAKARFFPPEAVVPEFAETIPQKNIAPGEEVKYSAKMILPLGEFIDGITFKGEKAIAGSAEKEFSGCRFDRAEWEIKGSFRVLDTGKFTGAAVEISTRVLPGGRSAVYRIAIPELQCDIPANASAGGELHLAPLPEKTPDKNGTEQKFYHHWLFWSIIAILSAAAVIIYLISRRKKAVYQMPLDEKTLSEIQQICRQVKNREIRAEKGFALLCDTVRSYLESRFKLPATRQTTMEFIRHLDLPDRLLPPEDRLFLTEFLNTCDRIKFAAAGAEENSLDKAAADASALVRATTEKEEEKQK